jgi:hypothetical protein
LARRSREDEFCDRTQMTPRRLSARCRSVSDGDDMLVLRMQERREMAARLPRLPRSDTDAAFDGRFCFDPIACTEDGKQKGPR